MSPALALYLIGVVFVLLVAFGPGWHVGVGHPLWWRIVCAFTAAIFWPLEAARALARALARMLPPAPPLFLALVAALFVAPAAAQDASPPPPDLTKAEGASMCLKGGGQYVVGKNSSAFVPTLRVEFDGPIALTDRASEKDPAPAKLRGTVLADIAGLAAPTIDGNTVSQVKDVESSFGLTYRVGALSIGSQRVTTALGAFYGIGTDLSAPPGVVLIDDAPTYWGARIRLEERTTHSWLNIDVGCDHRIGRPCTWSHPDLTISAEIPIAAAKDVVYFGGELIHPIGENPFQKPIKRITFGVQIPELVSLLSK